MKNLFLLLYFLISSVVSSNAQEIKFGKVTKAALQEKVYPLDSIAPAAILYKNRKTYYKYNDKHGFKVITKVHERIKIYNKEGFEWAKKSILTYHSNGNNETVVVKANTFNLKNGKIISNKLNKKDIYKDKLNTYWTSSKFTMPNVKVGSVIEWFYTITSPFAGRIEDVICQYEIPLKKIEIKIEIPQYYTFKYLPNFYYPINVVSSRENKMLQFTYKEKAFSQNAFDKQNTQYKTSRQNIYQNIYKVNETDIPAVKAEPLINNLSNYIAKIHFEHLSTKFPNSMAEYYTTSWEDVTKTIYKNSYFGTQLESSNFLKKDVLDLIKGLNTNQEKMVALFNFLKTQIRWNGLYGKYTDNGIRKAYQDHAGNVADINLCLVTLFRLAGLKANPVLISTKKHGIPLFPTINGFNYVIAAVENKNEIFLFDATEPYCAPNVLPTRVINWQGRLVRKDGTSTSISLFSGKPSTKRVNLFAMIDSVGKIRGIKRSTYERNYALNYRKIKIALSDNDLQSLLEENNNDVEISDLKITNKQNIYKPIIESFKFSSDDLCDVINDKIYFSPLLFLANNKNPFTLDKRLYPIDFGTKSEKIYNVSIKIPKGYTITSIPENLGIGLPNNMGTFKYLISNVNNNLQVLMNFRINTAIIPPNYYNELKDFFKQVIEKQTEKVVLTKL